MKMKSTVKKPVVVQIVKAPVKYSDKATQARLNTAASKMFFNGNSNNHNK